MSTNLDLPNNEQELVSLEDSWKKPLVNSKKKTREWLFKHAKLIHDFQIACSNNEINLPENGRIYFGSCCEEWLGYSADLGRKWARAGRFLKGFDDTDKHRVLERTSSLDLPMSMSTLTEFAAMTDQELLAAEKANLVHSSVTRQDVKEFRESFRASMKVFEAKKLNDLNKRAAKALLFEYTDNVPSWLVQKIEDLAATVGEDTIGYEMKHSQGSATFVCTRVNRLWDCTEIAPAEVDFGETTGAETVPKPIKVVKPATEKELDIPDGPNQADGPSFDEAIATLGINLRKKYVEDWALKALMKAAREAYHPDKLGNDFIFNTLPQVQEVLSK